MKTIVGSILVVMLGAPALPVEWPTAEPEAQGIEASVLESFHRDLSSGAYGYVDGMLVIRNGHLVFEKTYRHDYDRLFATAGGARGPYNYYDPDWHPYYQRGPFHTMQSVSKSVTSALIGIALGNRSLASVEMQVLPLFEGFRTQAQDPRWRALTLRDLLTMTSGIEWDETTVTYTDPKNSCARMEASENWVQFVLDQKMAAEPGEVFNYNSGVTMLLGEILKKVTGKDPDDYAGDLLFAPLGIEGWYWKKTPTGLSDTEGGLYLRPRDLAKIGYLYLHGGVWEGKRILPEGWVEESTGPAALASSERGKEMKYGYQWWLLPYERGGGGWASTALGYGGQFLFVVPEHDLVAVFTGWNIYDKAELDPHLALSRVVEAVR